MEAISGAGIQTGKRVERRVCHRRPGGDELQLPTLEIAFVDRHADSRFADAEESVIRRAELAPAGLAALQTK